MKMKKVIIIAVILMVSLISQDCVRKERKQQKSPSANEKDIETLVQTACREVGTVKNMTRGKNGPLIVVLEENHTSIVGQIQHAITLTRLHEKFGLKDIALEGYLIEGKRIDTNWYNKAAGEDRGSKIQVAVRLLKEGEISCAEFMKLVYDDITLYPIDKTDQYSVELDEEASKAPMIYLVKIAQLSLKQEHVPKIEQLQAEIEKLEGEQKQKKVNELLEYILSVDPWVKEKDEILHKQSANRVMSLRQMLALVEEINNRTKELAVPLEHGEKQAMNRNLEFWRARLKANETMLQETGNIADESSAPMVAMIIGAAHTEQISKMLKNAGRPFAVISPISLNSTETSSDLTWNMLNRKYKRQSVYTEGFTRTLLKAFTGENLKKPEPVLSESWLQAKSELYLYADRITRELLGGAGPPPPVQPPHTPQLPGLPGGGKPPFGFSADEFRGKWVYIDPNRISFIFDTDEKKHYAVLFPVILNPNDEKKRTEIWVKAIKDFSPVPGQERENVEYWLKKALEEVQSRQDQGSEKSRDQVEDKGGRVQITGVTKAIFTSNRHDAVTRSVAVGV
ncbi:MAG: hypothetical protein PVH61_13355 [Candidatus Aminicenantes bacterium]|jgi:hypothetical protein